MISTPNIDDYNLIFTIYQFSITQEVIDRIPAVSTRKKKSENAGALNCRERRRTKSEIFSTSDTRGTSGSLDRFPQHSVIFDFTRLQRNNVGRRLHERSQKQSPSLNSMLPAAPVHVSIIQKFCSVSRETEIKNPGSRDEEIERPIKNQ